MASIQMWLRGMGNEKLAAVGVRAGVCHRDNTSFVREWITDNFITKTIARAAASASGWVATLNHEVFDDAVEGQAVVEAFSYQKDEVVNGQWGVLGIEIKFNRTAGGFHRYPVRFAYVNLH
jgi:hypothetical protein